MSILFILDFYGISPLLFPLIIFLYSFNFVHLFRAALCKLQFELFKVRCSIDYQLGVNLIKLFWHKFTLTFLQVRPVFYKERGLAQDKSNLLLKIFM